MVGFGTCLLSEYFCVPLTTLRPAQIQDWKSQQWSKAKLSRAGEAIQKIVAGMMFRASGHRFC